MRLPNPHQLVHLSYIGKVRVPDKYYDYYVKQEVTRKAFYTKSTGYYNRKDEWVNTPNGYFHVPQYWRPWTWSDGTTTLTPHGFYHHGRVLPENIIKWELITDKELEKLIN